MIHEPCGLPTDPDRRYWRRRANRQVRKARRTRYLLRWSGIAAVNLAVLGALAYSGNRALRHLTTSPEFALRVVQVEGGSAGTRDRVRALLAELEGSNLPELDLDRAIDLARRDPWVLDCNAKRIFPHTLRVSLTEREPWVRASIEGRSYLVDRSGAVIVPVEPGSAEELPLLTGLDDVEEDMRPAALKRGADAVALLSERAAPWVETIAELDLALNDRIAVATHGSETRVLLDPERADRNLDEYLALESDIADRIGAVSYVDLRWRDRISVMPDLSNAESR